MQHVWLWVCCCGCRPCSEPPLEPLWSHCTAEPEHCTAHPVLAAPVTLIFSLYLWLHTDICPVDNIRYYKKRFRRAHIWDKDTGWECQTMGCLYVLFLKEKKCLYFISNVESVQQRNYRITSLPVLRGVQSHLMPVCHLWDSYQPQSV